MNVQVQLKMFTYVHRALKGLRYQLEEMSLLCLVVPIVSQFGFSYVFFQVIVIIIIIIISFWVIVEYTHI